MGWRLETGFRRDRRKPEMQPGPGRLVRSFAWSAVPPRVSRPEASFKATVGNWYSVARQIPIIPSTDRLLLKDQKSR